MYKVGVISDTHGLLRPEAVAALRGSDFILHAGDIGSADILCQLEQIAPTYAIRGNIDVEDWANPIPVTRKVQLANANFYLIHNRTELRKLPPGISAVIFGHTHQPFMEEKDDILYFNPGSAGPRRFKLPISIGRIRIAADGTLHPELLQLMA